MLVVLCGDILTQIILYLDDESCATFSHVCWHLYNVVHRIRPVLLITNNVFEAVRCGSLLSFKSAQTDDQQLRDASRMRDVSVDILKYIYNQTGDETIAYKLCKRDVLVDLSNQRMLESLTRHAINHNKPELLEHTKKFMRDIEYIRATNIDSLENVFRSVLNFERDMIRNDDVDRFPNVELTLYQKSTYLQNAIRHNAVDILSKHINKIKGINFRVQKYRAHDMTLEMAELLLALKHDIKDVVYCIVSSCNYRLTEMLRERGLYDKKLTVRSSHIEFTV